FSLHRRFAAGRFPPFFSFPAPPLGRCRRSYWLSRNQVARNRLELLEDGAVVFDHHRGKVTDGLIARLFLSEARQFDFVAVGSVQARRNLLIGRTLASNSSFNSAHGCRSLFATFFPAVLGDADGTRSEDEQQRQ